VSCSIIARICPRWFARRFACLFDPQPKGALHAFGRVCEWSNHAHEAYVHMNAPFRADATLVMVV